MDHTSAPHARRPSCLWLVTVILGGLGLAPAAPAAGEIRRASQSHCAAQVIPFRRAAEPPQDLLLSAERGVALSRVEALIVSRPDLFHFEHFDGGHMAGILGGRCAVEFWWSRKAGPYEIEEIRILGPVESVGRYHAYLRMPQPPQPTRIPQFESYRHVMSSAISPSGLSYIGLWHRVDGTTGSLVAAYTAEGDAVVRLGTARWNFDGVYLNGMPFHEGEYGFTLIDEPDGTGPLYMVAYDWTSRPLQVRGGRQP